MRNISVEIPKHKSFRNLTGQTFGRLKVKLFVGRDKLGNTLWKCRCRCGKYMVARAGNLKGNTSSCGCLNIELVAKRSTTHGYSQNRLFRIWKEVKRRCYNPKNKDYYLYGGRGIVMCPEWDNSFELFKTWSINNGYAEHLSLDRLKNSSGYSPKNCKWSTTKQQSRNKRSNHRVTAWGVTKCIVEWSEDDRCVVGAETLKSRLRYGWTAEQAISTMVGRPKQN